MYKITAIIIFFFVFGINNAQANTSTSDELNLIIERLKNEIMLLEQKSLDTPLNTNIPWYPPTGISVIDERGKARDVYVGKRQYKANAYDTLMVRWDKKLKFTDDTTCTIKATYGKATRSTVLSNTKEAYDHIGIYIPVTERYKNSNLEKVSINCKEGDSTLYRTNFTVKVREGKMLETNSSKPNVVVTARQERYKSGSDTMWFDYSVQNVPNGSSLEMSLNNMADGSPYPFISRIELKKSSKSIFDLSRQHKYMPMTGTIVFKPSVAPGLLPIKGPLETRVFDKNNKEIASDFSTMEIY